MSSHTHNSTRLQSSLWIASSAIASLSPLSAEDAFSQMDSLDTMVITGSQIAEPLRDTPVRTEVIDGEYLQRTHTRSLAEAVEASPGVRIDTACSNCNVQSIQMLGLPQPYIGLLFDGLPNFSTLASVYGIEQVPADTIGQIEIVKGGGSVLYGPGAVAGVINLIPREPEQTGASIDTEIRVSEGDSFGEPIGGSAFGIYDYVSDDKTFKASIYGGYDRIQPVDLNDDGFTDVSMRNLTTAGFRTLWHPVDEHTLTLDFFFADEERRGGEAGDAFNDAANQAAIAEELFSERYVTTLRWTADWTEQWNTRFGYSYSRTERDSYYGGTSAYGELGDPGWTPELGFGDTTDDLHFFDALANYEIDEKNRLTFGSTYETENLKDNQPSITRVLDETYDNFGVFAQHRYKPSEEWTFEYGLRGDFNSEIDDPIFSPRAAALWSPNQDLRVRGAVSTGFRAPEVFDEDLHIENVGDEVGATFNDPDLEEESSVTISVSPEWQINNEWRLELNTFHTWIDDTFVIEPNDDPSTPDIAESVRTNGDSSRVYGAELNVGYFAHNWSLELSWVQQRLEYENPQLIYGNNDNIAEEGNEIYSDTYVRTPESLGLLRFSHEGEWFDSYITGKLTGPMDVPRVNVDSNGDVESNELVKSDWFFNVDLGISKTITAGNGYLTASVGIKNLFDDYQDDLESGEFRDASYIYGPAFPRTYYAGLRYEF